MAAAVYHPVGTRAWSSENQSVVELGNPGGNLLTVEPLDLDNAGLMAKRQRHYLHRLIATVQLDDQPATMYARFAAPVRVRYEVRA